MTVAAGVAGTLVAIVGVTDVFIPFLLTLGIAIPPVAGIYLVDYFAVKGVRAYSRASGPIGPSRQSHGIRRLVCRDGSGSGDGPRLARSNPNPRVRFIRHCCRDLFSGPQTPATRIGGDGIGAIAPGSHGTGHWLPVYRAKRYSGCAPSQKFSVQASRLPISRGAESMTLSIQSPFGFSP